METKKISSSSFFFLCRAVFCLIEGVLFASSVVASRATGREIKCNMEQRERIKTYVMDMLAYLFEREKIEILWKK